MKNIVLYGETLYSSGGGLFIITLIARALSLKKKDHKLKLFLVLPVYVEKSPLKLIRRRLGAVKRFFFKLFGKKQYKSYLDSKILIDSIKNIDPDIQIFFYTKFDLKSLEKVLNEINADVILPVMGALPSDYPFKWVGGFYDFQYKYYPEFFPSCNEKSRDNEISLLLETAKTVLTISENSKNDLNKFFPGHKSKIFTLPLAMYPEKDWLSVDFEFIKNKYMLPKTYFVISNQLWIHKSHETAFMALKILHDRYENKAVHIVCTGITRDHRFPKYFDNLKEKISELELTNYIHFLGYIPKCDQIAIMKHSIAVVQPTLFEGSPGGGAAYDAIAIGIPAIVSDITVNLELKSKNISFFKAKSAEDLSDKMNNAYKSFMINNCAHSIEDSEILIQKSISTHEKIGDVIIKAIDCTLET